MIDNNIGKLHPRTKKKVQVFLDTAKDILWLDIYVFEARRTLERQYELYGKGRTQTALKKAGVPIEYARPNEKVVTWTLQSNHLKWKAVDIVFDVDKDPKIRRPSWNGNYTALIYIANYIGLRNLAPLELCHFEDNNVWIKSIVDKNSKLWHTATEEDRKLLNYINEWFRKQWIPLL